MEQKTAEEILSELVADYETFKLELEKILGTSGAIFFTYILLKHYLKMKKEEILKGEYYE